MPLYTIQRAVIRFFLLLTWSGLLLAQAVFATEVSGLFEAVNTAETVEKNVVTDIFEQIGAVGPVRQNLPPEQAQELEKAMDLQTLLGQVRAIVADELPGMAVALIQKERPLRHDEKLFNTALDLYAEKNFIEAVTAFVAVLNYSGVQQDVEQLTLIYLARIYYQLGMPVRSISLLEIYVEKFPKDPRREQVLFQVGMLYRQIGQYDAAISAFYRVLNAIILSGEEQMRDYLELARMAQFEIARTHFERQEWDQAFELFQRIDLFELASEDRETVRFYLAMALLLNDRHIEGVRATERFLTEYPESPFAAELLYEKARTKMKMNQIDAAKHTLIELIEMGGVPNGNVEREWGGWRRVAGNFLGNYYFKIGQYEKALSLYQSIVVMDRSPQWQLPIVMQMAACFRKLGQIDRAIEALKFIAAEVEGMRARAGGATLSVDLEFLHNSANWQFEMLSWQKDFMARLNPEPSLLATE
jgi:tetratricopeptide (TPR) repeat protein